MAGSKFFIYHAAGLRLLNAAHDFVLDNHYMALLDNVEVPDLANTVWSDVSANEIGDADYSPQDLGSESVAEASGIVTFDAADISFGDPVTITAAFAVILEGTAAGQGATDKLVGVAALKLGTTLNPNAAAAVDKGGGKVGIPDTAHGLSNGVTVLILGTVNYDGFYDVDATSSANEIVIAATFVAETFTGSETINECEDSSSTSGPFVVQPSASGLSTVDFTAKKQGS